jgi:pimeloyl-ACP methyl ester carboxylesterase
MPAIKPYKIEVPDAVLEDLQARLAEVRWPAEVEGSGWAYGTNLEYLRGLAGYWRDGYLPEWRRHEKDLNRFPHFRHEVDGVGLHFIHERGRGSRPTPLLLLHGWPDSFFRFHRIIPMLSDPARHGGGEADAFDVVVPSLPGFGFSDRKALSDEATADLLIKLMRDLGYPKFLVSGGDKGSVLAMAMARKYPDAVQAMHLTDVGYPTGQEDFSTFSPAELEFAGAIREWWMKEGAFNMIQSTKPQTLAFSLNDSPIGWAAWVLSFVCQGTGGKEMEQRLGRDELLTNFMIYWVTETIPSSLRSYYEIAHAQSSVPGAPGAPGGKAQVPASVAHCVADAPLPREWAERNVDLKRFSTLPGGHFAAWEEPEAFARDLRGFRRELG